MTAIQDTPSVPETIETVILPSTDLAHTLTPLIRDDVAVLSPADSMARKLHLHTDAGEVATQVNVGTSIEWETTLDLRL